MSPCYLTILLIQNYLNNRRITSGTVLTHEIHMYIVSYVYTLIHNVSLLCSLLTVAGLVRLHVIVQEMLVENLQELMIK